MERETKKITDSMIEHIYQVRPEHLNAAGRLFGGKLMEWIDEIAGLVGCAIPVAISPRRLSTTCGLSGERSNTIWWC